MTYAEKGSQNLLTDCSTSPHVSKASSYYTTSSPHTHTTPFLFSHALHTLLDIPSHMPSLLHRNNPREYKVIGGAGGLVVHSDIGVDLAQYPARGGLIPAETEEKQVKHQVAATRTAAKILQVVAAGLSARGTKVTAETARIKEDSQVVSVGAPNQIRPVFDNLKPKK